MIRWKPFEYQGQIYDLTHLHPKTVRYVQPAKDGKPARTYIVDVIFSLHCFTRRIGEDETPDQSLLYADSREARIFDFLRYELSKCLPEIIDDLLQRKCYHGRDNFLTVEMINPQDGSLIEYNIFFAVSRSSKRGVINLFVQSAYVRDSQHASNRPHYKPIRFDIILFNTLNNRPIRPPK
jgi:hypothetical protein